MANLFQSVKNGMSKLIHWTFENDKVYVDSRFVNNTGNYRK